jgi:hypothetical protein
MFSVCIEIVPFSCIVFMCLENLNDLLNPIINARSKA